MTALTINKELFPIDPSQLKANLCPTPPHIDKFYLYHGYRLTPVRTYQMGRRLILAYKHLSFTQISYTITAEIYKESSYNKILLKDVKQLYLPPDTKLLARQLLQQGHENFWPANFSNRAMRPISKVGDPNIQNYFGPHCLHNTMFKKLQNLTNL